MAYVNNFVMEIENTESVNIQIIINHELVFPYLTLPTRYTGFHRSSYFTPGDLASPASKIGTPGAQGTDTIKYMH